MLIAIDRVLLSIDDISLPSININDIKNPIIAIHISLPSNIACLTLYVSNIFDTILALLVCVTFNSIYTISPPTC